MRTKGKSGHFATEQLSLSIQNGDLFVDTNQDSWDDWGQPGVGIDTTYFLKSLDGFMVPSDTKGGMIPLLEARDSDNKTIRERIQEYGKVQSAKYTAHLKSK